GVLGGRGPHAAVRIEPGRALPLGIAVGVVRLLRNRVAAVLGRQVVLVGPGALEVVELDHVHPVRADRLAARALGVGAQQHVGHVGADGVDVRPVGQRRGVVAVGVVVLGVSEPFGHEVVRDVAVAAVIGVLVVGGRVADAEEHVGLAAVQDRVGIAADRGVGGPAGHRGVGAGAVPVLGDRHAIGIAVAILGAAGQVAVGRQVAHAAHVAQCGVVHLAEVVVRLQRGHAGVDLAEPVQVVDDAAVAHGAAAAVRRIAGAGAAGADAGARGGGIAGVRVVDDHAGHRIPLGIVDVRDAAGAVRIRLLGAGQLGRGHRADQLLARAHHATVAVLAALGQVREQA